MTLRVLDPRPNKAEANMSGVIKATYRPDNGVTTILVDADIVTIGVTLKVLEEKYKTYLKTLPGDLELRVRKAVGEALN